jgi:hypothetical protein
MVLSEAVTWAGPLPLLMSCRPLGQAVSTASEHVSLTLFERLLHICMRFTDYDTPASTADLDYE